MHANWTVLVVEDDHMVAKVIEHLLTKKRCSYDRVEDGAAALERLREGRFDALVTDLKMPGVGGLALLRAVREQGLDIPVVVISGFATEDEETEISALGAKMVRKPFLPPQIWDELGFE